MYCFLDHFHELKEMKNSKTFITFDSEDSAITTFFKCLATVLTCMAQGVLLRYCHSITRRTTELHRQAQKACQSLVNEQNLINLEIIPRLCELFELQLHIWTIEGKKTEPELSSPVPNPQCHDPKVRLYLWRQRQLELVVVD